MWLFYLFFFCINICITIGADNNDIANLITEQGFPVEKHEIITVDKYHLTLYRIPPTKHLKTPAKVVFLMHGLFMSAFDFIAFGPKYSLAYILSNAGYDVWIGNARGNSESRKHDKLKVDSAAYWDFSFHEIGKYDLPAMIDFALIKTNKTNLHYIGHSQGCTTVYIMLTLLPEYNEKILSVHAMSPAVYLGNSAIVPRPLISIIPEVHKLLSAMSVYEISLKNPVVQRLLSQILPSICSPNFSSNEQFCINSLFFAVGTRTPLITMKIANNIANYFPNSASFKQLTHFAQFIMSGKFQHFDYGDGNWKMYGQLKPPLYNVSNVICDQQVFYGTKDHIVVSTDIKQFAEQLRYSATSVTSVKCPDTNHFDFIYTNSANQKYYQKIIKFIKKYS